MKITFYLCLLQLSRLEGNVVAATKRPKVGKNSHSSDGKVLKEISRETQQLGKVTRFQLLDEKPRQNDYGQSKFEARKLKGDWSDISSIPKASYSGLNQGSVSYYQNVFLLNMYATYYLNSCKFFPKIL